jgi:L-seryl-tRNA(Ser) seleniumtransferase
VIGFTEEVTLEQLVELGEKYNLPVIMDLGSGVLVNLEKYGLAHEPTVQEQVKKGADLVCFSGDKLLGGPQAGIIVGKKEAVQKLEHYPLMRAIRLDKCAIAALAATFKEYLDETRAVKNIPVLHMIARPLSELKEQAEELAAGLSECAAAEIQVEESESMVGGGSLPGEILASYAVTIQPYKMSCETLMEKMRAYEIPVIGHIKEDKVWLDMRTVMPEDVEIIQNCLNEILS